MRLVFDRERRDAYGRLLAYVYAGGAVGQRRARAPRLRAPAPVPAQYRATPPLARLARAPGDVGRGLWGNC